VSIIPEISFMSNAMPLHLRRFIPAFAAAACLAFAGCMAPDGASPAEKRSSVQSTTEEVLADAYKRMPELKSKIAKAAGYGVFTNFGMKIIFIASGNGYGMVHDNKSGEDTYMKMMEVGAGLGLGAKKFRAVFVFNTRTALDTFTSEGFEFGGKANAAAKADDETGGAVDAQGSTGQLEGLEVYQFVDAGLDLSAVLTGMKFYPDKALNEG